MTALLRCQCSGPKGGCAAAMTQEDGLCDVCRLGPTEHFHIGPASEGTHAPMTPVAGNIAHIVLGDSYIISKAL